MNQTENKNAHQPSCAASPTLRVLCLGDVVGRAGRHVLREQLPQLRLRYRLDLVIANGENAAGGIGVTKDTAGELFSAGVDVITSGNHIWRHASCLPYLEKEPRLLRPANYPSGAPGAGMALFPLPCGGRAAIINLQGRTYMDALECPFQTVEALLADLPSDVAVRFIDFHAEATSEKRAMAHFLDGRVSAVLGTHTHVQTADAMILPGGTACLSDLGMCGCEYASVLGVDRSAPITKFLSGRPCGFSPARGPASINGALLEVDAATGKTLTICVVRTRLPGTSDPIFL